MGELRRKQTDVPPFNKIFRCVKWQPRKHVKCGIHEEECAVDEDSGGIRGEAWYNRVDVV